MIIKQCIQCSKTFRIEDQDLEFYKKINVPEPKLCPDCRMQRRLAWRNERVFYPGSCNACSKAIISTYAPNSGYTVYCAECWWSDDYDPLTFGIKYDVARPFFEQFAVLDKMVPKLAILNANSINSEYTHYSAENNDCYQVVGALGCENVYYSYRVFYSKDIIDGYDLYKCELCYQCVNGKNLFNCDYCKDCSDSNNLILCENSSGSSDCFGSINLRNKKFYIFNQSYSEEEYKKKLKEVLAGSFQENIDKFEKLRLTTFFKESYKTNCEKSTGDRQLNCNNCRECYVFKNSEDSSYCRFGDNNKDCYDSNFTDNCELQYNSTNLEKNYNILCSCLMWYVNEAAYCTNVFNSSNVFGCSGLKKQEFCILNTRYSADEYQILRMQIIDSLKRDGSWGDFFPAKLSNFAYNESIAHEYFPLKKEQVIAMGWRWQDELPFTTGRETITWDNIPKNISDVDDSILKEVLACEETRKNYRLNKAELEFYRSKGLPLPRLHPDIRLAHLRAKNNEHQLWHRQCMCTQIDHGHQGRCDTEFSTTYSPKNLEIVYCEQCYQKEIY